MRLSLKWLLLLLAAGLPLVPKVPGVVGLPPAMAQERSTELQKTVVQKSLNVTPSSKPGVPLSFLK